MPIWGLKTVAQVIATGFEGPQHCDEPWPYQFMVRQAYFHVLFVVANRPSARPAGSRARPW